METKTCRILQRLAKVGRVFSKIISVCCVVGIIGCFVGILSMAVLDFEPFQIGGVTIHSAIEKSAETSIGTMYAAMFTGMILCMGEAVIAKNAERYFKNELAAGTPFTFAGAKEMQRLGICIIGISVGALVAANIAYAIINHYFSNVADLHLDDANQVGMGIAFLVISLICKYGAEREMQMKAMMDKQSEKEIVGNNTL